MEFQNKFRERLKVKTLELSNLDRVDITEINILKKFKKNLIKFYKKFEEQSQKLRIFS